MTPVRHAVPNQQGEWDDVPFFYESDDRRASDGQGDGQLMPDLLADENEEGPHLFRPVVRENRVVLQL